VRQLKLTPINCLGVSMTRRGKLYPV